MLLTYSAVTDIVYSAFQKVAKAYIKMSALDAVDGSSTGT
jgi:hypothetical protein